MEEFTDTTPTYPGPIYFFDQLKPKQRKWKKEVQEDQFLHPKAKESSGDLAEDLEQLYNEVELSTEPTKAQENTGPLPEEEDKPHAVNISELKKGEKSITTIFSQPAREVQSRMTAISQPAEEDQSCVAIISEPSSSSKFSFYSKLAKMSLYGRLFEDYKLIASEVLYELEDILEKYAETGMTFPVGLSNLMTYSWQDLIEDFHKSVTPPKLAQDRDLRSGFSTMTIFSLKKCRSNSSAMKQSQKGNKKDSVKTVPRISDTLPEKSPLLDQSQESETTKKSVIHFSLTSKICFEKGWIPCMKWEILNLKEALSTAVERLQIATMQIKTEEAKRKREGVNKPPILHYYKDEDDNDEVEEGAAEHPQEPQAFWMELLVGKAQMPAMGEDNPKMKKFHYALVDGSSLTYYPSGRLAVCRSPSDLPWGGLYTNIFSDRSDPAVLGTFTPFGCGSISFPNRKSIAMMFNQDGGMLISKNGCLIREWMWPSKGKLEDPIEIGLYPDIYFFSQNAKEKLAAYKKECRLLKLMARNKNALNLPDPLDTDNDDPTKDISLLHELVVSIKLRSVEKKVKHIVLHWLYYYRCMLGLESQCVSKLPRFEVRKPNISFAIPALSQNAKEEDWYKEYLRYRNTFLTLTDFFKPLPYHYIRRNSTIKQCPRLPLLTKRKDVWFASQLACPVVLRRTMRGEEGGECRCSNHIIPEVTDLEYDHLIRSQLSHTDQTIVVCVFSAKEEDSTIIEVTDIYKEINKSRSRPCIQSRLDSFRLLKYDTASAANFTKPGCPLLVQRHNITPGIFLMYIRGKLLFANFIFNGYSTSANDLQKQILKTKKDYDMGYFLPSDFRIQQGQKIQLVVLSDNISIRKTLQGRKHREAQIFEIKTHGIELIPRLSYSDEPQGLNQLCFGNEDAFLLKKPKKFIPAYGIQFKHVT